MPGPPVEVPYFELVCNDALDSYFSTFGFSLLTFKKQRLGVAYSNGDIVIDIDYCPEDLPNYILLIGLSFLRGNRYDRDSGVGLWYGIPVDKQGLWRFRNQQDLFTLLCRVRDNLLPTYGELLWKDPQNLGQLISRFHSEKDAKESCEEAESLRRQAEKAFKRGDFAETVRIYLELSPVDLTLTHRKRFEIARKRL